MAFDAAPQAVESHLKSNCAFCPVQDCMGRGTASAPTFGAIVGAPTAALPGRAALYEAGQALRALYTVRAGCIKTYTVDSQGNEHIRGFHLPGDVVGLDGLGAARTRSSAAAVTPSQVCAAAVTDFRGLLQRDPAVAQHLTEAASRELALALAISGDFTAEQRMAAFLLHMEERMDSTGGVLRLPMTRRDIGSYLRLATETVCRTLKTFERKGWLRCEEKCIRLLARHKLYEVGEAVGICRRPGVSMALAA
ncbi:MAG: helix-turn-helix domain-containing protein [Nevskia sp.]|nr:helix-turn-helix domain-containing protein [Nevskia sp.]